MTRLPLPYVHPETTYAELVGFCEAHLPTGCRPPDLSYLAMISAIDAISKQRNDYGDHARYLLFRDQPRRDNLTE